MSDTLATIKRRYASRPGDVTHLIALAEQAEAQLRDVTAERDEERERHKITGEFAEAMQASYAKAEAERDHYKDALERIAQDADTQAGQIALTALAPTPPTAPERGED
jgi:hypothetical protein